jgi:hypothetical protein
MSVVNGVLVIGVFCFVWLCWMPTASLSFQLSTCVHSRRPGLLMGGGRSLEERKFSKKALFRKIRDQVNEAASKPGFFDAEDESKVSTACVLVLPDITYSSWMMCLCRELNFLV